MSAVRKAARRNDGWNLAAALGLLAVAFLWDRIAPPERTAQTKDDEAFPAKEDADRHASPADLATEGGDRGRHATSPSEIPAKGWKDILWRVYGNIGEHRILALAAGMTYYSLLAIFPAIAALVSIYGMFSDPGSIAKHLDDVAGFIPGGAVDVAREQLTRVATKGDKTLGFTFAIGLVISLWSANAAMKSLFDTLNIVYGEQEKRGFVKLNAISLGFTVGGIAFVMAALSGVVVIPVVLQYVGLSNAADLLVRIGRWPALFVALAVALACIYRFGPSRQAPRWTWITWGSAAATILWLAASALFSFYAANFGTFNATYGSLGAVIGFMTWLWISAIVILLGAELNAEIEHQTAGIPRREDPSPSVRAAQRWPTPSVQRENKDDAMPLAGRASLDHLALQGTVVAVAADRAHRFSKSVQDHIDLEEGIGVSGDAHAGAVVRHRYLARPPAFPTSAKST